MSVCCCNQVVERRAVTLKFKREQLLYDAKNYAYIEADVMGEEQQHAKHMLADIGDDGNVDRVSRVLALVHAGAVEMLYPFTKQEAVEEVIDDVLEEPEEYVIEMSVPVTMSQTTVRLLSKMIHEYMVYRVIADWLRTTNPTAAANWEAKAESLQEEIGKKKNYRRSTFTRKATPM